jgi:hypothetical protein
MDFWSLVYFLQFNLLGAIHKGCPSRGRGGGGGLENQDKLGHGGLAIRMSEI